MSEMSREDARRLGELFAEAVRRPSEANKKALSDWLADRGGLDLAYALRLASRARR